MRTSIIIVAGAAIASAAPSALAQFNSHFGLNHVDGAIVTEDWVSGPGYLGPDRVFAGQLDASGFAADPGTNSVGGTFPTPGEIGFNFLHELRVWDGSTFTPTAGETLTMSFAGGILSATTDAGFVAGWATAVRDESSHPTNSSQWGRHHIHPNYTLNPAPGQMTAADGVYLIELEWFYSGAESIATSDATWLLMSFNADGEVSAAADYVRNVIVPSPGAAVVLAGAFGLMGARRRRA
ncbi:MAG: hypothetical protein EA376_08820 [Phycisphaeraceae bacterium]|nr:MAG: hypothetical protein EA376_08820 [Phycisphaeraceae bacterium]